MALGIPLPTEMRMNRGHRAGEGHRVDTKPEVGAIAWSTEGYIGYVAWVSNVSRGYGEIESITYRVREGITVEVRKLVQ